jgi:2-polyprenyl-3-methyl-5-hydroxy-6-metoxy-1,4-benzoquinol methylase
MRVPVVQTSEPYAPASLQDAGHPEGHDYEAGSPHLAHPQLRNWVVGTIRAAVADLFGTRPAVRVLEIGAGHGAFTDHVLAAGASVTVTEMSRASAELLRSRFANNPSARVEFDATGELAALRGEQFDLILCTSVLHHIPDYLAAIESWLQLLAPGGTFLSFQDPLWYPRRSRLSMAADRGAYFAWRLGRGDFVQGAHSVLRRVRKAYDEQNPRDMVEYHVLRQGCDEQAIAALLRAHFAAVEILPYWSTQSRALQALGDRLHGRSTFAVRATDARP